MAKIKARKDPGAAALARKRWAKTTPLQRSAHARMMNRARWTSNGASEGKDAASRHPHAAEPKPTAPTRPEITQLWKAFQTFLLSLGEDLQLQHRAHYVAFRRRKNVACVQLRRDHLLVWARLDPASVKLQEGFIRDVRHVGHPGTGDLEIRIQSASELECAKPLLRRSYLKN